MTFLGGENLMAMQQVGPGRDEHDLTTRLLYRGVFAVVFGTVFTARAPSRVFGALWFDDSMEPRQSLMTEARSAARAAAGYAASA